MKHEGDGAPLPDEAYVDESHRRPLVEFNNPWTACITGLLAFLSLGLGMTILTSGLRWTRIDPFFLALPGWAQAALIILVVIIHFGSIVGATATLITGFARTGDEAAMMIRGRRFGGWRLGLFYFACFAAPWINYAAAFAILL